jgi:hypothetical protein
MQGTALSYGADNRGEKRLNGYAWVWGLEDNVIVILDTYRSKKGATRQSLLPLAERLFITVFYHAAPSPSLSQSQNCLTRPWPGT